MEMVRQIGGAAVDWLTKWSTGTQEILEEDETVLFVSVHRHDRGVFYPGYGLPLGSTDLWLR